MSKDMKIFNCNTEMTEVAEWCIASDKHEAYEVMDEFWDYGDIMESMYVKKYLKNNPGKTLDDFIEYFFIEEKGEELTLPYGDNNEDVTKTIDEWLELSNGLACYLCHGRWE